MKLLMILHILGKYRRRHNVTHISNQDFEAVQLAMLDVTESGTAVGAKIEGINICAKTGTAQNPHGKNHSLFVAFAPKENPKIAIAVVVENAGFGATWAAPIASLMIERYLNDSISTPRLAEVERISKADLIPEAIKHWYVVQDSLKLARLAKQIDADKAPTFENTTDARKITFDPEVEPYRKEPDSSNIIKRKSSIIKPDEKQKKPIKEMSSVYNNSVSKGIDWLTIWLYAILVSIGILCIFMVEYNPDKFSVSSFFTFNTNYSKQLLFSGICVLVAIFILLSDSKLYTAFSNLLYVFGILLMLLTFVIGKDINGSKSWIPLGGGFNLQPAELCKIFTALALAKYLSRLETDFSRTKSQIVADSGCSDPGPVVCYAA